MQTKTMPFPLFNSELRAVAYSALRYCHFPIPILKLNCCDEKKSFTSEKFFLYLGHIQTNMNNFTISSYHLRLSLLLYYVYTANFIKTSSSLVQTDVKNNHLFITFK